MLLIRILFFRRHSRRVQGEPEIGKGECGMFCMEEGKLVGKFR